jgi:hypothetical protein
MPWIDQKIAMQFWGTQKLRVFDVGKEQDLLSLSVLLLENIKVYNWKQI